MAGSQSVLVPFCHPSALQAMLLLFMLLSVTCFDLLFLEDGEYPSMEGTL